MENYKGAVIEPNYYSNGYHWLIPGIYDVSTDAIGRHTIFAGGTCNTIQECKNQINEFYMETKTVRISEHQVGQIFYTFVAVIWYYQDIQGNGWDEPETVENEIDSTDLVGSMIAWDDEKGVEYLVLDKVEIDSVMDSVIWEDKLQGI